MSLRRLVLCTGVAALLAMSIASPSLAYGKENWQTAFAGTAVSPGGTSFGFWGWCTFGGGVTSGNNGDCQFAEYVHSPQGSFTCQESLDISSWHIGPGQFPTGDFIASGTATVHPSALTGPCLAFFPGTTSTSFTNADTGIPGAAGHYNLNSLLPVILGASIGEFQIQVTQIP
jgi:hypothetical protein